MREPWKVKSVCSRKRKAASGVGKCFVKERVVGVEKVDRNSLGHARKSNIYSKLIGSQ